MERAEANVQAVQQQLADLQAELQGEIAALEAPAMPRRPFEASVKPKKTQIAVGQVALVWVPAA